MLLYQSGEWTVLIKRRRWVRSPQGALDLYDSLSYNGLIQASMVESVDTPDLKSVERMLVPVRPWLLALKNIWVINIIRYLNLYAL